VAFVNGDPDDRDPLMNHEARQTSRQRQTEVGGADYVGKDVTAELKAEVTETGVWDRQTAVKT